MEVLSPCQRGVVVLHFQQKITTFLDAARNCV